MAVSFTQFPWWLLGGKDHEATTAASSSINSALDLNHIGLVREAETVKLTSVKGVKMPPSSTLRKNKRKWRSREERRIDKEYDMVLVPSDGGCLSGSESDDSDWSIGWLEPHAPDFQSDDESSDNSFAVLVRCYGHGCKEVVESPNNQLLGAIVDLTDAYSTDSDGKKYMEQWLSSLHTADL